MSKKRCSKCKECKRKYRKKNKEYIKEYQKKNKKKIAERKRKWYQKNKKRINQYHKKYREENREKIAQHVQEKKEETLEKARKRYQKNKKKMIERAKKYYQKNKERIIKRVREHYQRDKEKINQHLRTKYKTNPYFRLSRLMSKAIRQAKNPSIKQDRSWKELIPYNLIELRKHLKSTLPKDYTWKDFVEGKLQIDHILPKAIFQYEKAEDLAFQICWGLDNLRLLPAKENLKKRAKLIKPFQKHFSIEVKIKK